jgi:hypothetical protein
MRLDYIILEHHTACRAHHWLLAYSYVGVPEAITDALVVSTRGTDSYYGRIPMSQSKLVYSLLSSSNYDII